MQIREKKAWGLWNFCVKRFIQTFITPEQNIHNVYHFTSQTSCAYIHTLCSLRQWHSKAFHVQFRVFGTAVQWQNTTKGTMLCLEEATNCHCQPWTKVFLEQEQFSSNCNQPIYKCISPPTHLSTTSREWSGKPEPPTQLYTKKKKKEEDSFCFAIKSIECKSFCYFIIKKCKSEGLWCLLF